MRSTLGHVAQNRSVLLSRLNDFGFAHVPVEWVWPLNSSGEVGAWARRCGANNMFAVSQQELPNFHRVSTGLDDRGFWPSFSFGRTRRRILKKMKRKQALKRIDSSARFFAVNLVVNLVVNFDFNRHGLRPLGEVT